MQEQTDIGLTQEKDWTDACRVNGISVLTTKDDIWGRRGFWFVDGAMAGRWTYDRLDKKWNFLPEDGMLDKTDMRIASVNGYVDDNGFHNRNLEDVIDEIIFRQRLARQAQDAEQAGLVLWVAADKDLTTVSAYVLLLYLLRECLWHYTIPSVWRKPYG